MLNWTFLWRATWTGGTVVSKFRILKYRPFLDLMEVEKKSVYATHLEKKRLAKNSFLEGLDFKIEFPSLLFAM